MFRAHDPQLDREVALKVAKPGTLDTADSTGRFRREARAAANLRHPHIVPVFDSGQDGDRHYIATGFVDGRTLEAEIEEADGKPLDLKRAAAVVRKLADALGYAHRQGVVHRDVKPANVLVDQAGEPSLTDFGLAMRAGDEAVQTQDGKVMGTPAYMSPEQATGRSAEATAASDQYALGVMLYETCTGRRPFDGPMELVIYQQTSVEPRRPRSENRAIPKDLETVILKCLEKNPAKRYGSCEALGEDLRRFLAGEPVTARRIGPAERFGRWCRRNPAVASSVSFGVLALLVGLVVALAQADVATREARRADDKADLATTEANRANDEKDRADTKAKEAEDNAIKANDNANKAKAGEGAARFEARSARDARHSIQIEQGLAAWERGDYARTQAVLNVIAPDYYDVWETVHLRNLWLRPRQPLRTFVSNRSGVGSACFSPDGKRVVTGSSDNTVRVWDAGTAKEMLTLKGHTNRVESVYFSPDGRRVVTGGFDNTAKVWDADNGKEMLTLKGHTGEVTSVCFSPDGAQVLTGSWDRTVKVWLLPVPEVAPPPHPVER